MKPSTLSEYLWASTVYDVRMVLRLHFSFHLVQAHQQYEVMAKILAHAFGGKSNSAADVKPVQSTQEAVAAFNSVFNPAQYLQG